MHRQLLSSQLQSCHQATDTASCWGCAPFHLEAVRLPIGGVQYQRLPASNLLQLICRQCGPMADIRITGHPLLCGVQHCFVSAFCCHVCSRNFPCCTLQLHIQMLVGRTIRPSLAACMSCSSRGHMCDATLMLLQPGAMLQDVLCGMSSPV